MHWFCIVVATCLCINWMHGDLDDTDSDASMHGDLDDTNGDASMHGDLGDTNGDAFDAAPILEGSFRSMHVISSLSSHLCWG